MTKSKKISYDVILVTLWPLCHRKTSSKKRPHPPIKWLSVTTRGILGGDHNRQVSTENWGRSHPSRASRNAEAIFATF